MTALVALESEIAIKTELLLSFSTHELLDCDRNNNSCKGGSERISYTYMVENGIGFERDYPYVAIQNDNCNLDKTTPRFPRINDFEVVKFNGYKEISLMSAVKQQSVVVTMSINGKAFDEYCGGIYNHEPGILTNTHNYMKCSLWDMTSIMVSGF
ncbi:hypothetical protein TSUD_157870 [Trifolium subterraneum]|uniref:Peptidase C1A papain C-terminal domain-containing protein n=1 Tax=Trifolium subterraneum TaxID=3900 RepID=A0A2Z6NP35_TRISU|nr:hypothetical protein TSUD_157870 [Trifolium subterraneum]